jgi:basic membrane protein A
MFKKSFVVFMSLLLVLSMLFVGCAKGEATPEEPVTEAEEATPEEAFKVGFVYVGPIGDGGWSYTHNEGRLYLEEQLGVETIYKESVPEGPEVEKVMKDMIDQGAKAIFVTSFGYMDYVVKVAEEFPEVTFLHCSGYKDAPNMNNYFGRIYEARYLSGIVAGLKTESDLIGYVAAYEIPEVIRGINAFTLGVQSVNENATVAVRWTHTWYDPAKEKEAGKALLDEGADVIAQHQDTAGPQQAAEERGAFSIGYHTDMSAAAPNAFMTAPIWDWGPYYTEQVDKIMKGEWTNEPYWGGMEDGVVKLAEFTKNAPVEAQAIVDEATVALEDGSLVVFAGPLYDQEGTLMVEEGSALSDGDMLQMGWFVKGVEGKIE